MMIKQKLPLRKIFRSGNFNSLFSCHNALYCIIKGAVFTYTLPVKYHGTWSSRCIWIPFQAGCRWIACCTECCQCRSHFIRKPACSRFITINLIRHRSHGMEPEADISCVNHRHAAKIRHFISDHIFIDRRGRSSGMLRIIHPIWNPGSISCPIFVARALATSS